MDITNSNKLEMNHTSSVITTLDGRSHNLHDKVAANFKPSFTPQLIAKVLSQNNRWNGNTIIPVNVAWHSIAVFKNMLTTNVDRMKQMTPQGIIWLMLKALFHDAGEVVTGDTPRPYKQYMKDKSLQAESAINELDGILDTACKLAILKVFTEKAKTVGYPSLIEFVGSLNTHSLLWDNINTIKEIVKTSDLAVAEIENWIWRKLFFEIWTVNTEHDTHTIYRNMVISTRKNQSLLAERYWFPVPFYTKQKQVNLFMQGRADDIDLADESRKAFLAIFQSIEALIFIFAKHIKDGPCASGYNNPVEDINYMNYFFPNYEEQLDGI